MAVPLRMLLPIWPSFRSSHQPISAQPVLLNRFKKPSPCLRRSFLVTSRRHATKPPQISPKPSKTSARPSRGPAGTAYKPFAQTLAERSNPTLLYQAASHGPYIVGCYALGIVVSGWALYAANQIYKYPSITFAKFLKVVYYGACVFAVGISGILLTRPFRIIHSIQAIPRFHNGSRNLYLQIESNRMLPFSKPASLSVPASSIHLSRQLAQERLNGIPIKDLEARRLQEERAKRIPKGNLFTLPFRQLSFLFWKGRRFLSATRRDNPFINVRVEGYNWPWKLGTNRGWALEEGRALDRIVKNRVMA
ncbi:MAG: hypothetical protein Q9212_000218 [Teloschistes hypoglaucus]